MASRLGGVGMYPAATPSITALAGEPRALLLADAVARRARLPDGTLVERYGVVERVAGPAGAELELEAAGLEDDDAAGADVGELVAAVEDGVEVAGTLLALVELARVDEGVDELAGVEEAGVLLAFVELGVLDAATEVVELTVELVAAGTDEVELTLAGADEVVATGTTLEVEFTLGGAEVEAAAGAELDVELTTASAEVLVAAGTVLEVEFSTAGADELEAALLDVELAFAGALVDDAAGMTLDVALRTAVLEGTTGVVELSLTDVDAAGATLEVEAFNAAVLLAATEAVELTVAEVLTGSWVDVAFCTTTLVAVELKEALKELVAVVLIETGADVGTVALRVTVEDAVTFMPLVGVAVAFAKLEL